MREAQEPANTFEQNLATRHPQAAGISASAVQPFSELLNDAAEQGMNDGGFQCHVRAMPARQGQCLDIVVVDSGPAIRNNLAQSPKLLATESDTEAISLAIRGPTSGRNAKTRTQTTHPLGSGLLSTYGAAEPETTETQFPQGTLVGATIPF